MGDKRIKDALSAIHPDYHSELLRWASHGKSRGESSRMSSSWSLLTTRMRRNATMIRRNAIMMRRNAIMMRRNAIVMRRNSIQI